MALLEIDSLTRRFGALTAVDALTLSVEPGEVFGLLGPNGAGKSTAIKLLTTLLPPSAGEARVAGYSITRQATAVRRLIGYVPQALSADGTLTGYENLLVFAKLYDLARQERGPRVRAALARMGLAEFADQLVRTYSGGMVRRLEIAQAMLHQPRLLFLDEPTVGLDPLARKVVWGYLRQIGTEDGTTILLTTHFMEEADSLCDRVAIMHRGQKVAMGAPAALKAALGGPEVTLDDVFLRYTGDQLDAGGSFRDVSRTRRTAKRLG